MFFINDFYATEKTVKHKHTNKLIDETSPYLLQHAHNPVNWYAWGKEALAKAKKENKPIFLSVGYSACHWCHVMEHECFEDEEIAVLLNKYFISVKVDREERPDIDDIYMSAVQAMTGQGGWPMSVFMTPEGKPYFGGTYFPKNDNHGRPGFMSVVKHLGETWIKSEDEVRKFGDKLVEQLKKQLQESVEPTELGNEILPEMISNLEREFDYIEGGFGEAPKFPASMSLDLYIEKLIREPNAKINVQLKDHLKLTLRKMAQGGMYDQIGGGFHRYSTDRKWYVPHFEKMLYDNALLARTYFEASTIVDHEFNLRIATEICDYVLLEMTAKSGAFYSTTDADSEDFEGKFFLWADIELDAVLGKKDADTFRNIYGIHSKPIGTQTFPGGTPPHAWFKGRIPHLNEALETKLKTAKIDLKTLNSWRKKCWQEREKRIHPGRDEKILSSWNGLMNVALTVGYRVSNNQKYYDAAKKNLDFIWANMQKEGRLKATYKDGRARHFATLEDVANVAFALINFHQVGGEVEYLHRAKLLVDNAIKNFADKKGEAFYYTAADGEKLIVRSKNPYDNAVPSANSVLAGCLIRLALLYNEPSYREWADGIFTEYSRYMKSLTRSFSRMSREYVQLVYSNKEYILLYADEKLKMKVLKSLNPGDTFLTEKDTALALLKGKELKEKVPTLYICTNGTCKMPLSGVLEIEKALKK